MSKYGQYSQVYSQSNAELTAVTRKELFLIATTFIALMLLNISALNHSIGIILLGFLCIFSLSSPPSALLALSASQIVADPAGIPITLLQSFFFAWGLHLFTHRNVNYRTVRKLLVWTVPYIITIKILNIVKWDAAVFIDNFDLAVMIGVMAAWYVAQLRERFLLGLFCIAIGASTSTLTFWLSVAGVAIEGITFAKGGGLIAGIGVGRGDGNTSGISISLAAISLLAWGLLSKIRLFDLRRLNIIMPYACIVFFIVSIPSIFASMSRGAVLTFFGGLLFVIISALYESNMARGKIIVFGFIAFVIGIIFFSYSGGLLTKYSDSMLNYSEKQARTSIMMSRAGTWEGAWEEIVNSPLIGTTPETRVSISGYGYDYASHNVWLDVGRGSGVLGMLWFTAFFFYPVSRLIRSLPKSEALLFCSPFVVMFFVFMNLSLMNYKIFYLLWVLAVAAAQDREDMQQIRITQAPLCNHL